MPAVGRVTARRYRLRVRHVGAFGRFYDACARSRYSLWMR